MRIGRVQSVFAALAVGTGLVVTSASAATAGAVVRHGVTASAGHAQYRATSQKVRLIGEVNVRSLQRSGSARVSSAIEQLRQRQERTYRVIVGLRRGVMRPSTLPVPTPKPLPITTGGGKTFKGWSGLTGAQQAASNAGDLEPPDQGLCVGGTTVMEPVNSAIGFYKTSGALAGVPVGIAAFFNLPTTSFLSDPRCTFDPATKRWFVSILQIYTDKSGNLTGTGAALLLAVSTSADPLGTYKIYSFDVTDNGKNGEPNNPNCPCFGDQPLLGMDANGVYLSANEYSEGIFTAKPPTQFFNAAQVYAIDKKALAAGTASPTVTHFNTFVAASGNNGYFSLQPTLSAADTSSSANSGTEFLLGSTDYVGAPGDMQNAVALWAVEGTSSLATGGKPTLVGPTSITSEVYGFPGNVNQKAGPTPLGTSSGLVGTSPLSTNDDRMNQTVYAGGVVWGALNTIVKVAGATSTGVAYFAVKPTAAGSKLSGTMAAQGYVAAASSVWFPSVAVSSGHTLIAFSLAGGSHFPSGGFVTLGLKTAPTGVHVTASGTGPEDGFTCYVLPNGKPGHAPCRWGDYSAALAGPGGVWFANEWIPSALGRDTSTNWGTAIGFVKP